MGIMRGILDYYLFGVWKRVALKSCITRNVSGDVTKGPPGGGSPRV